MSNTKQFTKHNLGGMDSKDRSFVDTANLKHVILYCDGSCNVTTGEGGYGTILSYNGVEKELHANFHNTTNNRMELMGVIAGLESLKEKCFVTVITDSQYVVDTMNKHWKINKNHDLWGRLRNASQNHIVEYMWVRGHNGHPQNERCDKLARMRGYYE